MSRRGMVGDLITRGQCAKAEIRRIAAALREKYAAANSITLRITGGRVDR
jgi:hypothetical protein